MSDKPPVEPIQLVFMHNADHVLLVIENSVTEEALFTVALTPDIARQAAMKLTWHSMASEDLAKG